MFHKVTECLEMSTKDFPKQFDNLVKMEDESDNVEIEIANYLTKVSRIKAFNRKLPAHPGKVKIVSEIESIAELLLKRHKSNSPAERPKCGFFRRADQ